jgi:hypothetical protein
MTNANVLAGKKGGDYLGHLRVDTIILRSILRNRVQGCGTRLV